MIDDEEIMEEEEVKESPLLLTMNQRADLIKCLRNALRWMKEQELLEDMVWIGISGRRSDRPIHDNRVFGVWKNGVGNDYPVTGSKACMALAPHRQALAYMQAVLDTAFPTTKYTAAWPNSADTPAKLISGVHFDADRIKRVIEKLEEGK